MDTFTDQAKMADKAGYTFPMPWFASMPSSRPCGSWIRKNLKQFATAGLYVRLTSRWPIQIHVAETAKGYVNEDLTSRFNYV